MKALVSQHVEDSEANAFGLWAFGKDLDDIQDGIAFMNAWNEIHGDVLKLDPSGVIIEDLLKMIELWRKA